MSAWPSHLGSRRILLAGDAEGGERKLPSEPPEPGSVEAKLVACCTADLKSDVLVVGHHGSLTSSRRAFLDMVGASVYAISSGPYPYRRMRLPDDAVIAELEARGQVLRTDRSDLFRTGDEASTCEMPSTKDRTRCRRNAGRLRQYPDRYRRRRFIGG